MFILNKRVCMYTTCELAVKVEKRSGNISAFMLFVRFRALRLSCLRRAAVRSLPCGRVFDSRRSSGPQVPLSVYNNNPVIALGSHVYRVAAYLPCLNLYPFVPCTSLPGNFHFRKARQIGLCQTHTDVLLLLLRHNNTRFPIVD